MIPLLNAIFFWYQNVEFMNEFIRRPRQSGPCGKTWNNVYQLQQQTTFEAKNYSDIQTNKKSDRNMKSQFKKTIFLILSI